MKYVKIPVVPVVVEAFQLGVDEYPEWFVDACGRAIYESAAKGYFHFQTSDDEFFCVENGDFIVLEDGEIYPCKEDIFKATYKPFEDNSVVT